MSNLSEAGLKIIKDLFVIDAKGKFRTRAYDKNGGRI